MLVSFLIIFILSIVQSFFGVGILLFGTPILLAQDYSFTEALFMLLPASLAISLTQVIQYKKKSFEKVYIKKFFFLTLPLIVFGLIFQNQFNLKLEIKIFVIIMLILVFLMRKFIFFKRKIEIILFNNITISMICLGIVHGLSNMGGAIVTPLFSRLKGDKYRVLAHISFCYTLMALIQIITLLVLNFREFKYIYLLGVLISVSTKLFIGDRLLSKSSERLYHELLSWFVLLTSFILTFSILKL